MRKYLWFLIPFSLGTGYLLYNFVLISRDSWAAIGLFVSIPVFLFSIVIGTVLQVIKSIRDHEFSLSKITIIIIVVLILFGVYLLLNADLPNFTPGYKV